jgi:hypothetical protein
VVMGNMLLRLICASIWHDGMEGDKLAARASYLSFTVHISA